MVKRMTLLVFTASVSCLFLIINFVVAAPATDKYVRIGNYYLKAGTDLKDSDLPLLAKYDLLVLPAEVQVYNRAFITKLRQKNPHLILLAYVPVRGVNGVWQDSLHKKMTSNLKLEWYLQDTAGKKISLWPGVMAMNLVSGWSEYLASFVADNILQDNFWDGIMYDEVDQVISFANNGNVDVDGNGQQDVPSIADQLWRNGLVRLLDLTRSRVGDKKIILINGSSHSDFWPYINGRIFESFPTPWEGFGRWQDSMLSYWNLEKKLLVPVSNFIVSDMDNTGQRQDFRRMRLGLTSALLGNGFFGFDFGTQNHGQLWWYDEYDAKLGAAVGAAKVWNGQKFGELGVYRRDFKQGIVLVNSSNEEKEVLFDTEYEHLRGTQDTQANSGLIVSEVIIPARDGVILLRPLESILGSAYQNGSFARVFSVAGVTKRTGFFAYKSAYRGSSEIIEYDVNGDGANELIVADGGKVTVRDNSGQVLSRFMPFDSGFTGSLSLAIGQVMDKNELNIVVAPRESGSGLIKVYRWTGQVRNTGFAPFGTKYKNGINLATGDLDANGVDEIIAGQAKGGNKVAIFTGDEQPAGKFTVSAGQSFGVSVAAGDVDGDGKLEIVTGTGFGAKPEISIYQPSGKLIKKFVPFPGSAKVGVRVAASDLDGDGITEILALTTNVFTTAFANNHNP